MRRSVIGLASIALVLITGTNATAQSPLPRHLVTKNPSDTILADTAKTGAPLTQPQLPGRTADSAALQAIVERLRSQPSTPAKQRAHFYWDVTHNQALPAISTDFNRAPFTQTRAMARVEVDWQPTAATPYADHGVLRDYQFYSPDAQQLLTVTKQYAEAPKPGAAVMNLSGAPRFLTDPLPTDVAGFKTKIAQINHGECEDYLFLDAIGTYLSAWQPSSETKIAALELILTVSPRFTFRTDVTDALGRRGLGIFDYSADSEFFMNSDYIIVDPQTGSILESGSENRNPALALPDNKTSRRVMLVY